MTTPSPVDVSWLLTLVEHGRKHGAFLSKDNEAWDAIERLASHNTEADVLREALAKCRDKFLHYEQLHRLKCTAEGDEKADRNREMADMCDAALKQGRG